MMANSTFSSSSSDDIMLGVNLKPQTVLKLEGISILLLAIHRHINQVHVVNRSTST